MSFLTEYLRDRPDRLPDRETLQATLAGVREYGHASLLLSLLAEHDRRAVATAPVRRAASA
jgi:hypothetical protein